MNLTLEHLHQIAERLGLERVDSLAQQQRAILDEVAELRRSLEPQKALERPEQDCSICLEDGIFSDAVTLWQPFGPGIGAYTFCDLGEHYRDFPALPLCDDHAGRIQNGEKAQFAFGGVEFEHYGEFNHPHPVTKIPEHEDVSDYEDVST